MSEYPLEGAPTEEVTSLLAALNERSEAYARAFYGY